MSHDGDRRKGGMTKRLREGIVGRRVRVGGVRRLEVANGSEEKE